MLNKEKIRAQIKKAIKVMPTTVILKRTILVPDGMGGFINEGYEPTTVATFDGLLNSSNAARNSGNNKIVVDGGNVDRLTNMTIICPTEDNAGNTLSILPDDFFTHNSTVYKIVNPNLIYEVYWLCELEVED